ncbi:NUDIX hydrolase [Candidimonas nitroreducens]|uniref:NrtR DNA-binding winged helix domain-containing protein n=1 Tax=Candidimonas nitroreducens TaxID=683354 RepID=A0A225N5H8_9BURK|nr:hypothetical protein [Candidimonas nitroreducens]OWT66259.1 hypothetical protein CEY11_00485 [Candidimonas nitroreducens]
MAINPSSFPDSPADIAAASVQTELVAVLVAVSGGQPRVLTRGRLELLPAGPFQSGHRSLQAGLRAWVETQTHHPLGYVEQLYTFADGDRANWQGQRIISVSYLGLTREGQGSEAVQWQDWYRYFPWEDWRAGCPAMLQEYILPALQQWCAAQPDAALRRRRRQRVDFTFGPDEASWNEELVLQRYELLFEAGLVQEAARRAQAGQGGAVAAGVSALAPAVMPGAAMQHDHRRILATAMARLRAKIRYRPVVFELMPPEFTLLQLQQTFEAVAGRSLHKQNFRRLIAQQSLVEDTGRMTRGAAGRPAKLFQFRGDVVLERAISGSKLPLSR